MMAPEVAQEIWLLYTERGGYYTEDYGAKCFAEEYRGKCITKECEEEGIRRCYKTDKDKAADS